MILGRRLWPLWLLALLVPVVHADDTNSPARKPAPAAATPAPKPATATAPKPSAPRADEEFLEFLGSVGEESDGEWIDYLSKTDISKVAGAKPKTAATREGE